MKKKQELPKPKEQIKLNSNYLGKTKYNWRNHFSYGRGENEDITTDLKQDKP